MSIVTPVVVFFAINPDEELTTEDIGAKWDVDPNNIGKTLRYAEQKGWVTTVKKPNPSRPTKQILFYTAGPRLLKEIGRCPPLESPTAVTSKADTPKRLNAALNSAAKMIRAPV